MYLDKCKSVKRVPVHVQYRLLYEEHNNSFKSHTDTKHAQIDRTKIIQQTVIVDNTHVSVATKSTNIFSTKKI